MKVEEKLKALEDELKLIKGEVRQTLVDVREFLRNLETPPPRREDLPEIEDVDSPGDDGHSPTNLSVEGNGKIPQRHMSSQAASGATGTSKPEPGKEPEGKQPEPQERRQPEDATLEVGQPTAQVNLLANLIRWVSVARREIGHERLATFLDVYGISSGWPPSLTFTASAGTCVPRSGKSSSNWPR